MKLPISRAKLNRNGYILYHGPSMLDGSPIVALAIGVKSKSKNGKTGAMLQTYILRADLHPMEALKSGADASVCGGCPLRPKLNPDTFKSERGCYVQIGKAPAGVYKCFLSGGYASVTGNATAIAAVGAGRKVRLGSYGDPAAVPSWVWDALLSRRAAGNSVTGYTHQSGGPNFDASLLRWAMVSADTFEQATAAIDAGYRTFYVRPRGSALPDGFVSCPAAAESGKRTTCEECGLCGGNSVNARSVSIMGHGNGAKYIGA